MDVVIISVTISAILSVCMIKIRAEYYAREILNLIKTLEECHENEMNHIRETIRYLTDKLSKL